MGQPPLERHRGPRHVRGLERGRGAQEVAEGSRQPVGLVDRAGVIEGDLAQVRRQRRRAVAEALLGLEALAQVARRAAVARVLEHPGQQLVGRLGGREVERLVLLLARQHQPRLELEQGGDQHEELGRRLEVELPGALEMVEVGDHHVGEVELEQVDLLAQHEREQQVERALEDLEVELERRERHASSVKTEADGRRPAPRVPRLRPSSTTRALVALALALSVAEAGGGCGEEATAPEPRLDRPATPGQTVVAALGDSIVAGSPLWDPDPEIRESLGGSLDPESQFEVWAEARSGGTLRLRNCGVFGERTDEIAARLEPCARGAEVLLVQGGINDIAQMRRVRTAASNLRATVRAGRARGLRVLIAEVLPWNNGYPTTAGRDPSPQRRDRRHRPRGGSGAAPLLRHARGPGAAWSHEARVDGRRRPSLGGGLPPPGRARGGAAQPLSGPGGPTPIRARTSASVPRVIERARSAPSARTASSAASSARSAA